MWVPAHVGIPGNEMADSIAKQALNIDYVSVNTTMGYSEFCSVVARKINSKWQREWETEKRGRHFYSIQQSIKGGDTCWGKCRFGQVIFSRLRLGHSGLAHDLARIGKRANGLCDCGREETVKHVLMECNIYINERKHLFQRLSEIGITVLSMRTLLNPTAHISEVTEALFKFLYNSGLYRRIY